MYVMPGEHKITNRTMHEVIAKLILELYRKYKRGRNKNKETK